MSDQHWCNSFSVPELRTAARLTEAELLGPADGPYDLNFCFPINTDMLESERVKLTPFLPRVHGQALFDQFIAHPELFDYSPFPLPETLEQMLTVFEFLFRRDTTNVLFVIIDKTREDAIAGTIAFMSTSLQNLSTELGMVIVFPAFRRTHVLTNAIGLLLRYCLNVPSDPVMPGIGLRRVEWQTNTINEKSIYAAERMGFRREGIKRWSWTQPEGSKGRAPRKGDPRPNNDGRDSLFLSLCWDDWESGDKEKVEVLMNRRS